MYSPVLNRWSVAADPFQELQRLHREVSRMFDGSRTGFAGFPALNAWSNAEKSLVIAEVPGVDPASIEVTVVGDVLTIEGERKAETLSPESSFVHRERGFGRFSRALRLPYEIESNHVQAKHENGVLRIELPRKESSKPRRIVVNNNQEE